MLATEDKGYVLRPANEWIKAAKRRPVPRHLLGELWREGEIAVLFGDTGMGKSSFAMQIAESIATGREIKPFRMNARPQKVLYLDLEMTDKQMEIRYARDAAGRGTKFLRKHYKFSNNLVRAEYDPAEADGSGRRSAAETFLKALEAMIGEAGARVVIIDSITSLKRSYSGARETAMLMTGLRRMARGLGLSVLVTVQTPRRNASQPLRATNLQEVRLLAQRSDNVFGIGESRLDRAGRYIKHFSARSDAVLCDSAHLPAFRLTKIGGNFLGFEFECFAPEVDLLADIRNQKDWATIERIKNLTDHHGRSLSEIADELGISKSTVYRLLKMWRPPAPSSSTTYEGGAATASVDGMVLSPGSESNDENGHSAVHWDLPEESYPGEHTDNYLEKIGMGRPSQKKLESEAMSAGGLTSESEVASRHNGHSDDESDRAKLQPPEEAGGFGLKRSTDHNGDEIFVESEDDSGRPIVWYQPRSNGGLTRWHRKAGGVTGMTVDGPICLFNTS